MLLALHRATHATVHRLATELVDLDLRPAELNVLATLADGRARTASRLGADVGSKPTTLTGVLDRLERRELITRGTRVGDRRSVVIRLTRAGEETAAVVANAARELERSALKGLSDKEIAGFHAVVEALS
ncbi:DNA-binding transcriptional regulator, MarR family [Allokutzneria albata]|uniref:DNA-binding transcriptional regulator, MarR family n=1 Tax=Allokutzneria albata TaxID=211114 RepID=A0A1G9TA41_ALLAB|nr:DNA-binding transcriptional regulator, MarR family [Allokutzneria albata]